MKSLKYIIKEGAALSVSLASEEENCNIINILQMCYCEEIFCWYKYFIAAKFLTGPADRKCLEELFEENGKDELEDHAARILERLNQFDWSPRPVMNISDIAAYGVNMPFAGLELRNDGSFDTVAVASNMLKDEVNAIAHYTDLELLTREIDPITNQLAKDILKDEQEHYQKIEDWLKDRQ